MRSLFREKILKAPILDQNAFQIQRPPLPEFQPFTEPMIEEEPDPDEKELLEEAETDQNNDQDDLDQSVDLRALRQYTEEAAAMLEADYHAEAESIIAQAKAEAETLFTEARREIQQLKAAVELSCREAVAEAEQKGYEAGFEEGYAVATQKAEDEFSAKLQQVEALREEAASAVEEAKADGERIRKEAEEERTRRILESEDEILKLAIDIAERIIRKEISRTSDNWFEMVKEAVEKVAGATEITIRVAVEDEAYLIQHLSEVQKLLTEAPHIRVVADSSLEPGDLIIQSNLGQLDARIKQQLRLMLNSLREEAVG
ncbi:MAG TPA: hypothetical protein GXZ36_01970 [Firmicutes bacterium]|nr:hypothetical protein [Bacillota bacterium]